MNSDEDKKLKKSCVRLIELESGYHCMVMHGPPPLIAEMFETWEDSYDAYCSRCDRILTHAMVDELEERYKTLKDALEKGFIPDKKLDEYR